MRRSGIEAAGWLLMAAGVAALVLPGPGLLAIVAGLSLLSLRYGWAKRLVLPIKKKVFKAAAHGVKTRPRIAMSCLGGVLVIAVGLLWGLDPAAPAWWPIADRWWLIGGWGTGSTLMGSGVAALVLIVYSVRRFRVSIQAPALKVS